MHVPVVMWILPSSPLKKFLIVCKNIDFFSVYSFLVKGSNFCCFKTKTTKKTFQSHTLYEGRWEIDWLICVNTLMICHDFKQLHGLYRSFDFRYKCPYVVSSLIRADLHIPARLHLPSSLAFFFSFFLGGGGVVWESRKADSKSCVITRAYERGVLQNKSDLICLLVVCMVDQHHHSVK